MALLPHLALAVRRPTLALHEDGVTPALRLLRIIFIFVIFLLLFLLFVVSSVAGVGEAKLLVGLDIPRREDGEEGLVNVALVDVARDDDAVGVAAVVLWILLAFASVLAAFTDQVSGELNVWSASGIQGLLYIYSRCRHGKHRYSILGLRCHL